MAGPYRSRQNNFDRLQNIAVITTAFSVSVLGLLVIVGWYSNKLVLTQVFPGFTPMRYNTALGFLLCGISLLAKNLDYRILARICGTVVLILSSLTLLEYLADVDLKIDHLLMTNFKAIDTERISPVSAVTFLISGIALLSPPPIQRAAQTVQRGMKYWVLGMLVFLLGLVAFFLEIIQWQKTFNWEIYYHMSLPASFGFMVLGTGIFVFGWHKETALLRGSTRWLGDAVGMAGIILAVVLWRAMATLEYAQIQRTVETEVNNIGNELNLLIEARTAELVRMAKRLEIRQSIPERAWMVDAASFYSNNLGYQAVAWVDPSFHIRWIVPKQDNRLKDLGFGSQKDVMQTAREQRVIMVSQVFDSDLGKNEFSVFVPLFLENKFTGFIAGVFDVDNLLNSLFEKDIPRKYGMRVFEGTREIYSHNAALEAHNASWDHGFPFHFHNMSWNLKIWPTNAWLTQMESRLPVLVLMSGIVVSVLLSLTVRFSQTAGLRALELDQVNRELEHDILERKKTEAALRESETRVRLLFESVAEGIFGVDLEGKCIFINPACLQLLGYKHASELLDKNIHALIHHTREDGSPCTEQECRVYRAFREGKEFSVDEESFWSADGSKFFVEYRSHPMYLDGHITGSVATFVDITERKKVEGELRRAATVFESTNEGIIIADADGKIVMVNQAFSDMTGYSLNEVVGRDPLAFVFEQLYENNNPELWARVNQNGYWRGELWHRRKSGEAFPTWENISVIKDNAGRTVNYVLIFSDISSIKQAEEQLRQLAHHDVLTGLPNRLLFVAKLDDAIERAKRYQHRIALLYLDLDRFKIINDTLGHAGGDELLKSVGSRLRKCVRATDTVARLGGDEFTVVLDDIAHSEDAAMLSEKIIHAMAEPISIHGREVVTSPSIGISIYPEDGKTSDDLVKASDAAMYRAKERGRSNFQFYTAELSARAYEHFAVENSLRQALMKSEFILHYQPQIDLDSGRIMGMEALVRWRHPDLELIYPDKFIALAEETGLIEPIGHWVLRAACAQTKSWQLLGLPPVRVSINLSGREILHDNNIVRKVEQALSESELEPGYLELEITESVLQTTKRSIDILSDLRSLGVTLAIDDFGMGFSSLSQLKHLPIDTLKIDRTFIRDIPSDPDDEAIASAIIAMGHRLNLKIIGEGVETDDQLDFLRDQNCDEAQGYLFSRPLPAEGMHKLLEERKQYSAVM